MKQYVIDQLRESDYYQIRDYLEQRAKKTVLDKIYQMDLPADLYTETQAVHHDCQPFYFAINLTRKQISFEWLIRSHQTLRCGCIGYASPEQRDHIISFADNMLDQLKIKI